MRPIPKTRILVASDWAPIRAFDPIIRSEPESIYGDLLPLLRQADLRIVNCECALTAASQPVWKSGAVFKGEPEHIKGLSAGPFDVVCLANNHVFDYGLAGFRETLRVLRQNGLKTVGAGLTEKEAFAPLTVHIGNTRITIINMSEGEDLTAARGGAGVCGWELDRILALVRKCRKARGCVLVIAHCGIEYIPYPPPYVAAAFRALIDAGADCVIGHHPHVPQGIEWHRNRPIAYSLGNFVFFQNTRLYHRKIGYCLGLELTGAAVSGVELLPYRISETGLQRLAGVELKQFHKRMGRLSRPLQTPRSVEKAWQAYLAYYGMRGFQDEVLGILEKMKCEPEKGAAMFRNRITTLQHLELWRDFLARTMGEQKQPYSQEAYTLVQEYFTREH